MKANIDGIGNLIEVKLKSDLKVITETLTRIGIISKKRKIVFPTCYIIEVFDKFYIFHFKEMFSITRSDYYNNISESDIHRKNSIIFCLKNWGMIDVVDESAIDPHTMYVSVLPFKEKNEYCINHKFNLQTDTSIN